MNVSFRVLRGDLEIVTSYTQEALRTAYEGVIDIDVMLSLTLFYNFVLFSIIDEWCHIVRRESVLETIRDLWNSSSEETEYPNDCGDRLQSTLKLHPERQFTQNQDMTNEDFSGSALFLYY